MLDSYVHKSRSVTLPGIITECWGACRSNFWYRITILYVTLRHQMAFNCLSINIALWQISAASTIPVKQRELSGCDRLHLTYCSPWGRLQTGKIRLVVQRCGTNRGHFGYRHVDIGIVTLNYGISSLKTFRCGFKCSGLWHRAHCYM